VFAFGCSGFLPQRHRDFFGGDFWWCFSGSGGEGLVEVQGWQAGATAPGCGRLGRLCGLDVPEVRGRTGVLVRSREIPQRHVYKKYENNSLCLCG
jgi:hypothetical protein